ncbi:MAG TPA: AAA family ATPase [Pirellulales bacterium]|jgi:ABC-type transport system involved in cytochrome c biogenesis ATPase subunit|nr:AAA family ATPase [Pirellulales bacterium]
MLLKKLIFQHYGPFAAKTELELEDDVTILTGANDTGKSSLLSLIERVCGINRADQVVKDSEINLDRIGESKAAWDQDTGVSCEAVFKGTGQSQSHVTGEDWGDGDEIRLQCVLPPKVRKLSVTGWRKRDSDKWRTGGGIQLKALPSIFRLPLADDIRTVINLESPNPTEKCFLQAAFGSEYAYSKYADMSDGNFAYFLSKAQGDISERLKQYLPPGVSLDFYFHTATDKRNQLTVAIRDGHSGHTPFGFRGAGVRRLISLVGGLVSQLPNNGHYLILLDEPEQSLHADAQHMFRRVLETIAQKPNIQVIYATHSSSMINTMKPSSLRVLRRTNNGEKATSEIIGRAGDGNFLAVRSSLGITAADSLLFAPVTIIVEGATEVHGLPLAFQRLHDAGIAGFDDVPDVLGLIHLLDGCGDEFEYLCRLAKSQGTKPIVFLDGDKRQRIASVRKKHPEVPILLLDGNEEFEQLVPCEVYFEAIRSVLKEFGEIDNKKMTVEAYHLWEPSTEIASQMAFTKKVDRWLGDTFGGISLEKPRIMKRALEIVPPDKITPEPFRKLLIEAKTLLDA